MGVVCGPKWRRSYRKTDTMWKGGCNLLTYRRVEKFLINCFWRNVGGRQLQRYVCASNCAPAKLSHGKVWPNTHKHFSSQTGNPSTKRDSRASHGVVYTPPLFHLASSTGCQNSSVSIATTLQNSLLGSGQAERKCNIVSGEIQSVRQDQ